MTNEIETLLEEAELKLNTLDGQEELRQMYVKYKSLLERVERYDQALGRNMVMLKAICDAAEICEETTTINVEVKGKEVSSISLKEVLEEAQLALEGGEEK
jgi:hypothetical protein